MSEENSKEITFDESVVCPDESAKAEPYYAIKEVDEAGKTTGQLWGMGGRLMIFESLLAAQKLLAALNNSSFQLRGVTAKHFQFLKQLEADGAATLFVVIGFTPKGDIEAMPLSEHLARKSKAGSPPPLPPRS